MKVKSRTLAQTTRWNLLFQYLAVAFALVSGILLVPLYLRVIPLELYGAWLASGNLAVWLTAIDPGLSTVLQQRVAAAYGANDRRRIGDLACSGIAINLVLSVVVVCAGLLAGSFLDSLLNLSAIEGADVLRRAFFWAVVSGALLVFSYVLMAIGLGLQGSIGVGVIHTVFNVAAIVATVLFLYRGHGLMSIPYGNLVRSGGYVVAGAGYVAWRMMREKLGQPGLSRVRELLGMMSYTFMAHTGMTVALNADLFIVNRFMGAEAAAVFGLTRRAPELGRWVTERPAVAAMPELSHLAGGRQHDVISAVIMKMLRRLVWMIGLVLGGFLAFNADFVRLWVGGEHFAGTNVNVLMCAGMAAMILCSALTNLCVSLGEIRSTSNVRVLQSIALVGGAVLGAMVFGMAGVAAAPLVACLIPTWIVGRLLVRCGGLDQVDVRILLREGGLTGGAMLVATIAFAQMSPAGWPAFLLLAVSYVAFYALLLALLSRNFRQEFHLLRRLIPAASSPAA